MFDRRFVENAVDVSTERMRIHIDEGGGAFEWLLYTPEELSAAADGVGLRTLLACSGFSEQAAADASTPRFQVVLERPE